MTIELERPEDEQVWTRVPHELPRDAVACLVHMCQQSPKAEICGFITASHAIIPIPNVSSTPEREFVMDQGQMMQVLFRERVIGTYHSHPTGRPWPSAYDTDHIGYLYQQGCPWDYYIVTNAGVFRYEHRDRRVADDVESGDDGCSRDAGGRPD
ncbi:capsid maturation protease [Mycobacterium phage Benzema]|nr:capsid maturation protease [Mycobacterium phage Benzema]